MVVISDIIVQGVQMLLVLLLAPLLTGYVRKIKARLVRRQGASVFQPYRDLLRLLRKEVVLADNASWLFRVTPYITFAAIWVAAALVPTFATGLVFNWTADLIAIVALLGSARFFLALAGMDVGTSFGGIGSSREVMIAALAEPAMLLIVARPNSRPSRICWRHPMWDCEYRSGWRWSRCSWWRSRRTRAFRSTIRRRTSNSPWCTRR